MSGVAASNRAIITDLEACKRVLDAISDPEAKFKAFDEMTDQALSSTAFKVLETLAKDPEFPNYAVRPYPIFGPLGPQYVSDVLTAAENSVQLSDAMMKSLDAAGKSRLWSICPNIDTYIHNKIFLVLGRIILTKNFANSNENGHPLHSINDEMWKFQTYNHGKTCPCHEHIKTHPSEIKADAPAPIKITRIAVKYDGRLGDRLFIRGAGPGMSWEKGLELKNVGNGEWVYETQADFPHLDYKILLNDNQWELGDNHKADCGKKEAISPRF